MEEIKTKVCKMCGRELPLGDFPTNNRNADGKDHCDKDLSLALKEAGYIGQGRCYYDLDKEPNKLRHFGIQVLTTRSAEALNFILAVHLYDAQKWLREERDIHIEIPIWLTDDGMWKYSFRLQTREFYDRAIVEWDSYESALSEGIKEAIKILKEK